MARNRVVIETITCDICGDQLRTPITKRIGLDQQSWNLDLCENDAAKVVDQIKTLTANAQKAPPSHRQSVKANKGDWEYLESLGFTRHRGRKTPAENAALANR